MDTRKVQLTGKSTYSISLPKLWAIRNGICAGKIVYVSETENGALVLNPEKSDRKLELKIDVGAAVGDPLVRDIIGAYISGYRKIEVTSPQMSPDQKREIRQIVQKLIGPEILEENINNIIIHDLLGSDELHVKRVLERINSMAESMVRDSFEAVIECNRHLAEDVVRRDDDVDRLNLLTLKQFIQILRSGSVRQGDVDPLTAFFYTQAASHIERVGDHAYNMAKVVLNSNYALGKEEIVELRRLEDLMIDLMDNSIKALLSEDSDVANAVIQGTEEIRKGVPQIASSSITSQKMDAMAEIVFLGSVERILDYINNVAELTINLKQAHAAKEGSRHSYRDENPRPNNRKKGYRANLSA